MVCKNKKIDKCLGKIKKVKKYKIKKVSKKNVIKN